MTSLTEPVRSAMTMQCPVCPASDIPPDAASCGNCGADLLSIRRIRDLPSLWVNRALAAVGRDDPESAIAPLQAALAIDPSIPGARIVLGKVLWCTGRRRDAVAEWRRVDSTHEDRAAAERLIAAAGRARNLRVAIAATVSIAVLAILALIVGRRAPSPPPVSATPRVVDRAPAPVPAATPEVPSSDALDPALVALAERLATAGNLRVDRDSDTIRVVPLDGLFSSGAAAPTPEGAALLERMRVILHSVSGPLHVVVTGYTDAVPPQKNWKDNWSLALARAAFAVDRLRSDGAPIEWYAASGGDHDTPFPEGAKGSQARNRTVVVEITSGMTR